MYFLLYYLFYLFIFLFCFAIPNVPRGDPHPGTTPAEGARISNIVFLNSKNENYVHGGVEISIISFVD